MSARVVRLEQQRRAGERARWWRDPVRVRRVELVRLERALAEAFQIRRDELEDLAHELARELTRK